MMKKVLIISYYWPPAGGPGVQRIVKYVRHLPEFGWIPLVLTVEKPTSPASDESLLKNISNKVRIYKTGAFEPFNIYRFITGRRKDENLPKDIIVKRENEKISEKISRLIRANMFIPDARVGWIPYMVKEGMKIIRDEKPTVIFSTSPPHSLQLGAKKLAKKSGLPWIADFRDPWIEAYWESDIQRFPFINRLNKKLEKNVLSSAKMVTTVSEGFVDLFSGKAKNEYEVLYHGFDFINQDITKTDRFTILYIGNMGKFQSPLPVLQAIQKLPEEIKNKTEFIIVGKVYDGFDELKRKFKEIKIIIHDFMPYHTVMTFSHRASLLLLINPTPIYGAALVPVKIYDYLALRKPILAIGTRGGRLEELINETMSGNLFEKNDHHDILHFIRSEYQKWDEDKYRLLKYDRILDKYRAKENVKKLTQLFDRIS
jgi:glycosyltransferase involved in cell wall biosynthesis